MGGGPDKVTNVTEVPQEFKPHFVSLFNNSAAAARQQAANSAAFGGQPQQPIAPQLPPAGPAQQRPPGQQAAFGGPGNPFGPFLNSVIPHAAAQPEFSQAAINAPPAGNPFVGTPFPGPFIAPANPLELASIQGTLGEAANLQGAGDSVLGLGQAQAQGQFLTPDANPFLQQTIQSAIQPQIQAFRDTILPGFESAAIGAGAFKGSSARDIVQSQLGDSLLGNIGRTAGNIAFGNFANERQLQQNAPGLIDAGARLNQLSPSLLGQAGESVRNLEQQGLDERLLQFQEGQTAPFRPLFPLASIIQGGNIGQQSQQVFPRPSPIAAGIQGALGGGAAGAALGNAFGSQSGFFPGGGALFGALGGLLG